VTSANLGPFFKLAFFTLLGLTIVFVVLALAFAFLVAHPSESQSKAESWMFGAASSTLSALIGMLVGKVA
jgi:uncharacterized protein YpmS